MAMRIFNADETIFTSNGLKSLQPIYCHEIRNESEWYLDVRVPLSFVAYYRDWETQEYRDWETDRKSTRLNSSH